jgi:hypothetical protein
MQDRPRPTDRRLVLLVALVALAVLVLRAPMDVLAVLTPSDTSDDAHIGSVRPRDAGGAVAMVEASAGMRDSGGADALGPEVPPEHRFAPPAARPTTALVLEELRGGWRVESGVEESVALAVLAGHSWAATSRAMQATSGAVIVTVEAVERPGAHHAVVTLLIAAPARGAHELHRIAVPVMLDADGPVLAGAPWVLPAPTMRTSVLQGSAIGDGELIAAARRALEGVGVPGERLVALEVTDGWPFIARLDDDADGHPWLRWHVDRFVVAGLPLDAGRG